MDFDNEKIITVTVLPLRGLVVFPKSLIHFDVGRKKSITAINKAMKKDQLIFLATQKDAVENEPAIYDLYQTGVLAKVVQVLKQPENTTSIVIEGNEYNYMNYLRKYCYNLETKEYTGEEQGYDFEKDGSSGGDLVFDTTGCDIEYSEDEE